jgi:hypothetical protein
MVTIARGLAIMKRHFIILTILILSTMSVGMLNCMDWSGGGKDSDDDSSGDDVIDKPDIDEDDEGDDFTPVGDCNTYYIYAAIEWLIGDCYGWDGPEEDIDEVCENVGADRIACFLDCYSDADHCGGDSDPLKDCLTDCQIVENEEAKSFHDYCAEILT